MGTFEPYPCPPMSLCPEGTDIRVYYGGVALFAGIDALALIITLIHLLLWRPRVLRLRRRRVGDTGGLLASDGSSAVPSAWDECSWVICGTKSDSSHSGQVKPRGGGARASASAARFRGARPIATAAAAAARSSSSSSSGGQASEAAEEGLSMNSGDASSGLGALLARGDLAEALLKASDADDDPGFVETLLASEGGGAGRDVRGVRLALEAAPGDDGFQSSRIASRTRVGVARRVLLEAFSDIVRMRLDFDGLEWSLPPPSGRKILHGVSGSIQAGRFTAIMGPSGAGKTTFLNLLLGKYKRTAGSLRVNGQEGESMAEFKKLLGFVPQDDTLMAELTVREHVTFAARMRLPRKGWPEARLSRHVSAVLDVLGLTGVADSQVGDVSRRGISGGQRKRTNIALELVVVPCVLLLDGESA